MLGSIHVEREDKDGRGIQLGNCFNKCRMVATDTTEDETICSEAVMYTWSKECVRNPQTP